MKARIEWNTLVERRPWLARAMLVVCSLSLLATSPEHHDGYASTPLETSSLAPACALTAEAPSCEYLVTITHDLPDPDQPFFTTGASASIRGNISMVGVTDDVPFVTVRVASADGSDAEALNALTQFSSERALAFTGGCHGTDTSAPCVSAFTVSLSRTDQGARGGTATVSWGLDLQAYASSGSGSGMGSGEPLPWSVEYTPR